MEFLEIPLYDDYIIKLLVRFGIDLVFLSLVVAFVIYPNQRERNFAFTAVMLNVTVFFICFTLKKLEIDIGMALGLFAIFGVLRYRTDAIGTKEMTYLFILIGIAVINSLSNKKTSYAEIVLVNSLIFSAAMLKEWIVGRVPPEASETAKPKKNGNGNGDGKASKYTIEYDKVELLGETTRQVLLDDLRGRTGMNITKVQVKSIDLAANKATLLVWC
ncbi:DUF4956 domain-containing protein [Roseiconus nitratireducens]|uniref:DUF4956 domain-containing protein n=1 Tax=Roseiconus nitratireducens TaxID=2605748 RepID=A0A5M6DNT6_9BACT|nr:DUF4956 domain-containing protein [Roseiconus nitratireducens]KAA5547105.1 DUF4956 domain-containing protein [Roseiconus nitratireducens]